MKYCVAILLTLASLNSFAGLTKWVDSQGVVHYTDGPPPPNVKSESMRAPSTSTGIAPSSAPAAPKTIFEKEADLKKEKQAREAAEKKAAEKQAEEAQKQKTCEQARSQLTTMQNSPRVVTYNDQGERTYMDDAQRQQKIDEAQDAISKYCSGGSSSPAPSSQGSSPSGY